MSLFIVVVICAVISMYVGAGKGRTGQGVVLGLLLGPLGLIIMLLLPDNEANLVKEGILRKCPYCAEAVKHSAVVCKHCGKDLPPVEKEKFAHDTIFTCTKCGSSNHTMHETCQVCGEKRTAS